MGLPRASDTVAVAESTAASHREDSRGTGLAVRDAGSDAAPADSGLSRKRKSPGAESDGHSQQPGDEQSGHLKKVKLDAVGSSAAPLLVPEDRSALPAEVWNHIFTFCPPRTLGNLLRVNKLFNSYLDPASSVVVEKPPPPLAKFVAKAREPNALWRSARRSFWPNMPGPLKDKTELDMWRLSCSPTCQFCGKRDTRRPLPATDPLRFGPGTDGVSCIWGFRVRCCGSCLSSKSMKEMELILSEGSTFLMPALPFVFATADPCIIPLSVIERGQLPPSSTLTKLFWSPDVEGLREEFGCVKELGAPAVEEWQKGLSIRGSDQRADVAKWEKYAESGGVTNMRTLLYPGYQPKPLLQPAHVAAVPQKTNLTQPPAATPVEMSDGDDKWAFMLSQMTGRTNAKNVTPSPPETKTSTSTQHAVPNENKTKEQIDADWDEIQGPVRLKILKYADEAIIGDWDEGEKVTKDNAPTFAADVLLHVRKRFYMEVEKDAQAARAAGREPVVDPPEGPFTQKLSLENMKYVFDVKVKPITGNIRKELFLCNACDYNGKFFGFEGVIQHFAAKHTTVLSVGNIVVHWRAEWPSTPPFKPYPRAPKSSFHPLPAIPPRPAGLRATIPAPAPPAHGYNQFSAAPPPAPQQPPVPMPSSHQAQMQQPSFSGADNASPFASPYVVEPPHPPPQGPLYPQASTFPPNQQSFQQPAYQQPPQTAEYQPYIEDTNPDMGYLPTGPAPLPQTYRAPAPVSAVQIPPPPVVHDAYQSTSYTASNPAAHGERLHLQPPPQTPYHVKLDETARHARGLWKSTVNMNQLPGVVRIFTIIYFTNKFFQARFGEPLAFPLFIDGLSNRKEMRPIRNINELPCKACYLGLGHIPGFPGERKLFSFPQLVNHFQSTHTAQPPGTLHSNAPPLNWMTDMLLLPQPSALSDMVGPGGKTFPLLSEAVEQLLGWPEQVQAPQQLPQESIMSGTSQAAFHNGSSAAPGPHTASVPDQPSGHNGNWDERQQAAQAANTQGQSNGGKAPSAWKKAAHENKMQRKRSANGKKKGQQKGQNGQGQGQKNKNSEPNGARGKRAQPDEEEEKQEQEERRQEEAIRAMWVADRAQKMQVLYRPLTEAGASQNSQSAPDNRAKQGNETASTSDSTARRPDVTIKREEREEEDRLSARRVPRHNVPTQEAEEPDLLGALEMHLGGAPSRRSPPAAREAPAAAPVPEPPRDPARVVYVDERGRPIASHHDPHYLPREEERYARYVVGERGTQPPQSLQRRPRSRSGYYPETSHEPPPRGHAEHEHYRVRSPLPPPRRYAGEPAYERGPPPQPPPQPSSAYQYARTAQPRQEYYQVFADEGGRAGRAAPPLPRPVEYEPPYEAYEVVRVIHPDGDYYARRPVRREPPQMEHRAAGRYYASTAHPATAPPPSYEDAGGRTAARGGYAEGPPGPGFAYSAAYDPQAAGPMYGRPRGDAERSGHDRAAAPPPQQQQHQHRQQSIARADQSYYEEYDPQRPSMGPEPGRGAAVAHAPPPGSASLDGGGRRPVRYQ